MKNFKKNSRLVLHRETLRALSTDALAGVQGAAIIAPSANVSACTCPAPKPYVTYNCVPISFSCSRYEFCAPCF